jgi:hypothetical protein
MPASRRGRENYVRPPILGREPPPRWVAIWRFRLITMIIGAALAVVTALVVLHFVNTEQNPTFGGLPGSQTLAPAFTR